MCKRVCWILFAATMLVSASLACDDGGADSSSWRTDLVVVSGTYRRDGIGNFIVDGEIENRGSVTWCFVRVSASGYEGNGDLVDNGWSYADMRCIRPEDVSPFTVYIDEEGRGIESYKVKITAAREK